MNLFCVFLFFCLVDQVIEQTFSSSSSRLKLFPKVEAGANVEAEIKFWGNQTWKPIDYCKRYNVTKALHALETSKKVEQPKKTMAEGVDFD